MQFWTFVSSPLIYHPSPPFNNNFNTFMADFQAPYHPQAETVHKIIAEARTYQGKDFKKAIELLEQAKKKLSQSDEVKVSGQQTVANNTIGNANTEVAYWSKLANLHYNIHQYDKSLDIYQKLPEKIQNNPEILKAVGDNLRKLGRYDEAIKKYEDGVNICKKINSYAEFQAPIRNSEGLTYLAQGKYDQAANQFKKAIDIDKKNPLYYCNLASAYSAKGGKSKATAIENYEVVQKMMLQEKLEQTGLTKDNIKFINNTLSTFLENYKKLQDLNVDDVTFQRRFSKLGILFSEQLETNLNNLKDGKRGSLDTEYKLLLDAAKTLKLIKDYQKLKLFKDAMLSTLIEQYYGALSVKSGKFSLDTSNLATLASLLPIIGSTLSTPCKMINEVYIEANASNIRDLSVKPLEFSDLAQDVVLKLIFNNKNKLMEIDPDSVLRTWIQTIAQWLNKKKEDIINHFFGGNKPTSMEKYGKKIATDLLSKQVATGKVYRDQKPSFVSKQEKIERMASAAEEILKADIDLVKDYEFADKENKCQPCSPCCDKCEIY